MQQIFTITTAEVLKLEEKGGILTDPTYFTKISRTATVEEWAEMFPNVDRSLLEKWYKYVHSYLEVTEEIDRLKKE